MPGHNHTQILNMRVDVTSYEDASRCILKWCLEDTGRYICVSNVHMCMESFDSPNFRKIVNEADLIVPDGRPLVWAQKLLGQKNASQVRGADLLLKLCTEAEKNCIPIGLYGGTDKSLDDFIKFLKNHFPRLIIPFYCSPPFRELTFEEDKKIIEDINASGTKILFVGIGCPKQEKWMAIHKAALKCAMLGVGAAFDFFSGQKKHAPRWMQRLGLEWFFRLLSDPVRLWKRYLKHNPRFIFYLLKQIRS